MYLATNIFTNSPIFFWEFRIVLKSAVRVLGEIRLFVQFTSNLRNIRLLGEMTLL